MDAKMPDHPRMTHPNIVRKTAHRFIEGPNYYRGVSGATYYRTACGQSMPSHGMIPATDMNPNCLICFKVPPPKYVPPVTTLSREDCSCIAVRVVRQLETHHVLGQTLRPDIVTAVVTQIESYQKEEAHG
jgi:hypothetical protein